MAIDARVRSTNAPNRERGMQTGAFSVRPQHLEAIRDAAQQRRVSQSEIVREVLDRYFSGEVNGADGNPSRQRPIPPSVSRVVRDLAVLRGEIADLRRLIERLGDSSVAPPQGRTNAGVAAGSAARDLATLRCEVDDLRQIAWRLAVHSPATGPGHPDDEHERGLGARA